MTYGTAHSCLVDYHIRQVAARVAKTGKVGPMVHLGLRFGGKGKLCDGIPFERAMDWWLTDVNQILKRSGMDMGLSYAREIVSISSAV